MFTPEFYAFLGFVLSYGGSSDVTAYNVAGNPWMMTRYPRRVAREVNFIDIAPMVTTAQRRGEIRFPNVPFTPSERDKIYETIAAVGMLFNDSSEKESSTAALVAQQCVRLSREVVSHFSQNEMFLCRAIGFAAIKHAGQTRLGGELHLAHVLRVGLALAQSCEKQDRLMTVVAGILHDTLEDTKTTDEELTKLFGVEVTRTVRALSHIEEEEPDEVYLARVADGGQRAVRVKRADKLDNLWSLAKAPTDFRVTKITETRVAFPIWQQIDPEAVPLFEAALAELERSA